MVTINKFLDALKGSIETHSQSLLMGDIFLPEYCKDKVFTKIFRKIPISISEKLNVDLKWEVRNKFPKIYDIPSNRQDIDYVFSEVKGAPIVYLEVESLDGSQLMHFSDGAFDSEEYCWNKLWYYYGTLGKHYTIGESVPRYFVWLLILPDKPVSKYRIYDADPEYQLISPNLKPIIYENPYRFYDKQIKALARAFLYNNYYFYDANQEEWFEVCWDEYQSVCELVFITCTINDLIISRGKDYFDRNNEVSKKIKWNS